MRWWLAAFSTAGSHSATAAAAAAAAAACYLLNILYMCSAFALPLAWVAPLSTAVRVTVESKKGAILSLMFSLNYHAGPLQDFKISRARISRDMNCFNVQAARKDAASSGLHSNLPERFCICTNAFERRPTLGMTTKTGCPVTAAACTADAEYSVPCEAACKSYLNQHLQHSVLPAVGWPTDSFKFEHLQTVVA